MTLSGRSLVTMDDLSNGTAVSVERAAVQNECDIGTITMLPVADIIWVVDESMLKLKISSGSLFSTGPLLSRALSSGLDFRMAVTGMVDPAGPHKAATGRFCSRIFGLDSISRLAISVTI